MNHEDISVVLLDDHAVLRDGLERILEATDGLSVVGSMGSPSELSKCFDCLQADVVVMGLVFEECDALRCIADCAAAHPNVKILVLSQLPEMVYAQRVLNVGAHGYLMKSVTVDVVLDGIRKVVAGEVAVSSTVAGQLLAQYTSRKKGTEKNGIDQLSDRELHALTLIGQGYTTANIAKNMGICKKTVDSFKERIKVKLSLQNSTQLAQAAVQHLGRLQ